jgi:hypothetical protein
VRAAAEGHLRPELFSVVMWWVSLVWWLQT